MSLNSIRTTSYKNNKVQSFKIAQQICIDPIKLPKKNNTQTINGKKLKELIVKYIEDDKEYNDTIFKKLNIDYKLK